jgi:hypothetical protein
MKKMTECGDVRPGPGRLSNRNDVAPFGFAARFFELDTKNTSLVEEILTSPDNVPPCVATDVNRILPACPRAIGLGVTSWLVIFGMFWFSHSEVSLGTAMALECPR